MHPSPLILVRCREPFRVQSSVLDLRLKHPTLPLRRVRGNRSKHRLTERSSVRTRSLARGTTNGTRRYRP